MSFFNSIRQAQGELSSCYREMSRMKDELSGCDWCCGGGDEAIGDLRTKAEQAKTYLASVGVRATEPKLCHTCHYGDPVMADKDGLELCRQCFDWAELQGAYNTDKGNQT